MSTFYRKYRPQTVEELDLKLVRDQLQSILKTKEIPSSFIFSGPKGSGKTSAARIIAKTINCQSKTDPSLPCNECEICKSITRGGNVDVFEMDGASNRGIDDIRTLRESLSTYPTHLQYKVYIIDEVHMLTNEAFNALLKSLEEPPAHVVFIFATTELGKIPETILSRTFHIQFYKATNEEIKRSLQRVIFGENLQVNEAVLDKIVTQGGGGFRDSVKILEQLSYQGKTINEETFDLVFPPIDVLSFLKSLKNKNQKAAFDWIEEQIRLGADVAEIFKNILVVLQTELLAEFLPREKYNLGFSQKQLRFLTDLSLTSGRQLKFSLMPVLLLQLLVVDFITHENGDVQEPMVQKEVKKEIPAVKVETFVHQKPQAEVPQVKVVEKIVEAPVVPQVFYSVALDKIEKSWADFINKVAGKNKSASALLKSAQPFKLENDILEVKVFYSFHKDRLETTAISNLIQDVFNEVFASKTKIRYILGEKTEQVAFEKKQDESLVEAALEIFS